MSEFRITPTVAKVTYLITHVRTDTHTHTHTITNTERKVFGRFMMP